MTALPTPRAFSLELALVIGLPVLTIIAGAYAMTLAYGQGFTPEPVTSPPALSGQK